MPWDPPPPQPSVAEYLWMEEQRRQQRLMALEAERHAREQAERERLRHAAWLRSLSPEERAEYKREQDDRRAAEEAEQARAEAERQAKARRAREKLEHEEAAREVAAKRVREHAKREHDERVAAHSGRLTNEHRQRLKQQYESARERAQRTVPGSLHSEYHFGSQWFLLALPAVVAAFFTNSGWVVAAGVFWPLAFFASWELFRNIRHSLRLRAARETDKLGSQLGCGQWPCDRCGTHRPSRWPQHDLHRCPS